MPYYRLYHLNRSSGHIDREEQIEAADDVAAVGLVRDRERETTVELWQEGRKILRLEKPSIGVPSSVPQVRRIAPVG